VGLRQVWADAAGVLAGEEILEWFHATAREHHTRQEGS
jgi:hypothetical protein